MQLDQAEGVLTPNRPPDPNRFEDPFDKPELTTELAVSQAGASEVLRPATEVYGDLIAALKNRDNGYITIAGKRMAAPDDFTVSIERDIYPGEPVEAKLRMSYMDGPSIPMKPKVNEAVLKIQTDGRVSLVMDSGTTHYDGGLTNENLARAVDGFLTTYHIFM